MESNTPEKASSEKRDELVRGENVSGISGHEINLATKKNVRRFGLGLKDRKIVRWVFGALGTVIVGLVVAIVVVNNIEKSESEDTANSDKGSTCASNVVKLDLEPEGYELPVSYSISVALFSNEIVNKFESGDGYSFDNAMRDYENALIGADSVLRIYITTQYAFFMYNYGGDFDAALAIMESSKPENNDNAEWYLYLSSLTGLYKAAHNELEASKFQVLANEYLERMYEDNE